MGRRGMAKSGKGRTRSSPPATALASKTTTTSSSSSTNPEETTSPYFLPDLIPLIASRLTTLQDFFALRATCRAYRARLPLSSSNLASQGPLLLVGHKTSADVIFNVPLRRILRFRLPHAPISHGRRSPTCFHRLFTPQVPTLTCFQSMGCRVAIRSVSASATRPELRVCHLLTGERARLPDLPNRICGVLFSDDLVLAFMPWYRDIYYCRIGDAEWQAARCDEGYKLCSLVFVKGTLYALTSPNYRLAVVELENNSVVLSFLGDDLSAQTVPIMVASLAECHEVQSIGVCNGMLGDNLLWRAYVVQFYQSQGIGAMRIDLNYALFQQSTTTVSDNGLTYTNLFDAMVDAMYTAMEKAGVLGVPIVVSESGWPSASSVEASREGRKCAGVQPESDEPRRAQEARDLHLRHVQ
ncbi:Glucan endo-1,3-beta-glucosidase GIII [Hordeum vulgare]|nr:Glucan endo-1,3-beta-glucosidase GIII [Hordeum vulgare]